MKYYVLGTLVIAVAVLGVYIGRQFPATVKVNVEGQSTLSVPKFTQIREFIEIENSEYFELEIPKKLLGPFGGALRWEDAQTLWKFDYTYTLGFDTKEFDWQEDFDETTKTLSVCVPDLIATNKNVGSPDFVTATGIEVIFNDSTDSTEEVLALAKEAMKKQINANKAKLSANSLFKETTKDALKQQIREMYTWTGEESIVSHIEFKPSSACGV